MKQGVVMGITAYRGGKPITDELELQAYLASLLRLENVGLLLGAGASCSAGGQTMRMLWSRFLAGSSVEADWLLSQGFITDDEKRLPLPPLSPPASGVPVVPTNPSIPTPVASLPNFEVLLDRLEVAILEWERQGSPELVHAHKVRSALFRAVVNAATLKEDWWKSPLGADLADELWAHRSILQKLTAARQPGQPAPWVFTTNYDLAIEWAAESVDLQVINGFLGVHSRRFSPQSFDLGFRNAQAKGEARFGVYNIYLAKLHGSLTWKEVDHSLYEVPASEAWRDIENFLDGFADTLSYLVLPRAAKYLQTVGYVMGELLRRFAEFMARPQTALVINGYGFGDEHINRLIRSALLNPTLQVVVYLPEFKGDPAAADLPQTVRRLLALQTPRLTIVGGGSRAFTSALANDLPDPTVYDQELADLRRRLMPEKPDGTEDDES